MPRKNKVVITGMGVIAANGIGLSDFWDSLLANRSGIGRIQSFDSEGLPYGIAGEVKNFEPGAFIDRELKPRRMGRFTQFALSAALMARDDAGLSNGQLHCLPELPVVMGVSTSDMLMVNRRPTPFTAVSAIPHAAASAVGYALHNHPALKTLSDGCASGLDAVGLACGLIMSGRYDVVIAGATDSSLTPYTVESLVKCGACAPTRFPPERASRPFDRDRTSGIVAEGAAMLVLENAEHAMARNARIYAEIAGVGHAADHRSAPEGAGMGPAMRQALANAGLSTRDVDYVNAHAPSDPHMDAIESTLIKEVFNGRAYAIPVTSIKGATGCPMGAAGVQQIVTAALVLEKRIIPPTTNFEQGDTSCDLDYVPLRPRSACVRVAIVNSHGFGRSNASIVLAKGD